MKSAAGKKNVITKMWGKQLTRVLAPSAILQDPQLNLVLLLVTSAIFFKGLICLLVVALKIVGWGLVGANVDFWLQNEFSWLLLWCG